MIYQLKADDQGYHIMHVATGECAGYLEPLKKGSGFIVHRALALGNEREKIAVIKSIDEAVPTLGAYYEKNPPRWKGGAKARRYIKWTFYGVLTVERQGPGEWTVERSGAILVRSDDDAIFATSEEAKRVADIHIQDGFPNAEPVDDGFSWYDYRACVAGPAPTIETKVSVFSLLSNLVGRRSARRKGRAVASRNPVTGAPYRRSKKRPFAPRCVEATVQLHYWTTLA